MFDAEDSKWSNILKEEGEEALLLSLERYWCEEHQMSGFSAVCEARYWAEGAIEEIKDYINRVIHVDFWVDMDNVTTSDGEWVGDLRFTLKGKVSAQDTSLELEVDPDALDALGCEQFLTFTSREEFENTVRSWPLEYWSAEEAEDVRIGDGLVARLNKKLEEDN